MTTRRRRSSGSGQPGSRAWRESVQGIRRELDAGNGRLIKLLEEQDAEYAKEVRPLFDLAESLRVEELLSYMNDTLLNGQGVIQTVLRWDGAEALGDDWENDDDDDDDWDDDDDEDDEEDDDEDFELSVTLTVMLSWKQAGRLQIKVEIQEDDGEIELNVNGHQARPPNARNLQSALVAAFREQMDENYGRGDEINEETAAKLMDLVRWRLGSNRRGSS